jgi:hypothetical protein
MPCFARDGGARESERRHAAGGRPRLNCWSRPKRMRDRRFIWRSAARGSITCACACRTWGGGGTLKAGGAAHPQRAAARRGRHEYVFVHSVIDRRCVIGIDSGYGGGN